MWCAFFQQALTLVFGDRLLVSRYYAVIGQPWEQRQVK